MPAKRHQIDQFRTEHGSQTAHAVIIDPVVEACSDGSGSELKKLRSVLAVWKVAADILHNLQNISALVAQRIISAGKYVEQAPDADVWGRVFMRMRSAFNYTAPLHPRCCDYENVADKVTRAV